MFLGIVCQITLNLNKCIDLFVTIDVIIYFCFYIWIKQSLLDIYNLDDKMKEM